jgi:hypothetical protein
MSEPQLPQPSYVAAGAAGAAIPFTVLLDQAVKQTRRNLRRLFLPVGVPWAVFTAAFYAVQLRWQFTMAFRQQQVDPLQAVQQMGAVMGFLLVYIVVVDVLALAVHVVCLHRVEEREIGVWAAIRFALRPSSLWTMLLVGLCCFAATLCCVLPVFYVAPLLGFSFSVMVIEGQTGVAALRRSAELARHNPTRSFTTHPIVRLLAIGVSAMVASYAVNLLVSLPGMLLTGIMVARQIAAGQAMQPATTPWQLWLMLPFQAAGALANTVVAIYSSFAVALLFFDTRSRREGGDLQAAIAGMSLEGPPLPAAPAAPPPAAAPPADGPVGPPAGPGDLSV